MQTSSNKQTPVPVKSFLHVVHDSLFYKDLEEMASAQQDTTLYWRKTSSWTDHHTAVRPHTTHKCTKCYHSITTVTKIAKERSHKKESSKWKYVKIYKDQKKPGSEDMKHCKYEKDIDVDRKS